MRAVTVRPGVSDSARLDSVDTPPGPPAGLVVRTVAVGICGTDMGIVHGGYGTPVPGHDRLVIGHESLGVVEDAPAGSGYSAGDRVVGIVRRPDPVPCPCCAAGHWDMCVNGRFVERGIKDADGYAVERFRLEPEFAVAVGSELGLSAVLLEPASILAKAWRRIDAFIGIGCSSPATVLVTGAGPIGLLAALFAVQRGYEVHVLDRVESGPKPTLVEELGARYHSGELEDACPEADITLECTGVGELAMRAIVNAGRNGIVCLTGVSEAGSEASIDAGRLNSDLVLHNGLVFGSVNANRADYEAGAAALAAADPSWLATVITRQVPLDSWEEAYVRKDGDVKTVLVFE